MKIYGIDRAPYQANGDGNKTQRNFKMVRFLWKRWFLKFSRFILTLKLVR